MRYAAIVALLLGLWVAPSPGVAAADTSFVAGGVTFYLNTNSVGGTCNSRYTWQTGVTYYVCADGDTQVEADTENGCADVKFGQCYSVEMPSSGLATSEVNCTGASYRITTRDDEGGCTFTGSGSSRAGTCTSGGGEQQTNSITANCEDGCGNAQGSGCCCTVGSCEDSCDAE